MGEPAPPQYSPDGKLFWDGTRWMSAPGAGAKSFFGSIGGCLGIGCLGLMGLVVLGMVASAISR